MEALRFEYPKGVRFRCLRCSLCCMDTGSRERRILLLEAEARRISEEASIGIEKFVLDVEDEGPFKYVMRKENGRCVFLKDNLCSIYELRPVICRFYPFKLERVLGRGLRFSYTEECPGIGRGPRLSRTYFEELLNYLRENLEKAPRNDRSQI
ncbi:MAG: YkgJ family cysteine cluster protein [Candidatus Bathyarchaeia archaeon]